MNTADIIVLFNKKLREFCDRNNIEMGIDTIRGNVSMRKYVFLHKANGFRRKNFNGNYMIVNFNEIEDVAKTFDTMVQRLIDDFELCVDTDSVKKIDILNGHPIFITTCGGKSEFLRQMEESSFYSSPEWRKTMLNAIYGKESRMSRLDNRPTIEKVYFNKPYTIVIWSDKTKTMVKAEGEAYDEEKGLAMAICKKFLGTNKNHSDYFDEFKRWLPKIDGGPVKEERKYSRYVTAKEFAELSKVDISTVRKHCRMGLITGAIKQSGAWLIPVKPREGKTEV